MTATPGHDPLASPIKREATDGASIAVTKHGAHVLSWRPAGSIADMLFVSSRATAANGAAIRGGVPVIFPQFAGRGPLQKHGFARNIAWREIDAAEVGFVAARESAVAAFELTDDAATRAIWPHPFRARFAAVAEGQSLRLELTVINIGDADVEFTAALHTYLAVDDCTACRVTGLEDAHFVGTAHADAERGPEGQPIAFGVEVDRIYRRSTPVGSADPSPICRLETPGRTVEIANDGLDDTVVWNPGPDVGAKIADLGPGEWQRFICIEAGAILAPIRLAPGARWTAAQLLQAA
ncbi:MAG: D-hexose-6-phosphate mutarotase [Pseudomonadota bacterium]